MKKIAILVVSVFAVAFVCNAQQKGSSASALTGDQAKNVAKMLKRHNVMMDFCGCCEKSTPLCIKIEKVTYDSIGVTVTGTDITTGEKYKKTVDVAETWVPQLKERKISKMQCVGKEAGIQCDPCTTPSVPTGKVGEKMLIMELDGLMEAEGGRSIKSADKGNGLEIDRAKVAERKAERVEGQEVKKTELKKGVQLDKRRIDRVGPMKRDFKTE